MPVVYETKTFSTNHVNHYALSYTKKPYVFDNDACTVSPNGNAIYTFNYLRSVVNNTQNICDYIKMGGSFELCICFKVGSLGLAYLWCIADASGNPNAIWVASNGFRLTLKFGSSASWSHQSYSGSISTNTKTWVKLIFTGESYQLQTSTDGVEFTTINEFEETQLINVIDEVPYDCFLSNNSYPANSGPIPTGVIYLDETYFKYNGTEIWRPANKNQTYTKTVKFNKYY